MKTSLIVTVLNEELSINALINSIVYQSSLPDEIIIVDGGSTDSTISKVKEFQSNLKNKIIIKLFSIKGNRALGRNLAVMKSSHEIILCTDSGCIMDKNWVREITKPFQDKIVDAVAGYYKGIYKNIFQKSLIPYVLVMEDKINPHKFLPASRSMAFKKNIWQKAGGFDENLSHNEDYAFAKKLVEVGALIVFQKSALVNWIPRNSYKDAFIMFFRFAFGDIEAGIIRYKVLLLFVRYLFGLLVFYYLVYSKIFVLLFAFCTLIFIYFLFSIYKNYKYVNQWQALYILPLLQLTSDIAVLSGSIIGFKRLLFRKLNS